MRASRTSRAALLAVAAVVSSAHAVAFAEPISKDQCIDAHVRAQDARRERRFGEAADALKICLDPACPSALRDDCAQRLDELQRATPTIIFVAKDGDGRDLSEVEVAVDGKPRLARLDGSAVAIDPGEHVLAFKARGGKSFTKTIVVVEGEKGRRESVVIGEPSALPSTTVDASTPLPRSTSSARRTWGYALGGVGLVSIGLGTYFGLHASSLWSDSKRACSVDACPDHAAATADHDRAVRFGNAATVSFLTGGALVASGLVLIFTAPTQSERPAATSSASLQVLPAVSPDGAAFFVRGSF